ncbi:hypothetical protein AB4Y32_10085 [Paraburkholderia phymatum]|uniref:Uncharacterized protein n=1 Tax=Paraburkholderia phymatum TaxID=148447 RepID=A0ACC6TXZ9_9BURK
MKHRGVVYDVGLNFNGNGLSVEPFDPALVKHDFGVIANVLHANAVRIEGEVIDRLESAARVAAEYGLTVFFNPWKMGASVEETLGYLKGAAQVAEKLMHQGVDIVFVAGCEYSIFSKGVFSGETFNERVSWFASQYAAGESISDGIPASLQEPNQRLNDILVQFATVIRAEFSGALTYSAGVWEDVDWSIFDWVGVDYYRRGEHEVEYLAGLDRYKAHGTPLAVMEFGCCAYEGAAAPGDGGFTTLLGVNPDGSGFFKDDIVPTRSETEQANYVETQLSLFVDAGVDAAFVFVFSFPCMPIGEGAKDLDMMSFSLVKTYSASDTRSKAVPPWAPKAAYHRVADHYKKLAEAEGSYNRSDPR